jgi:hypothetical protein
MPPSQSLPQRKGGSLLVLSPILSVLYGVVVRRRDEGAAQLTSAARSAARSAALERSLRAFERGGSTHMADGRPRHHADIRDKVGQHCTVLIAARGHLQAQPWWTPSPEVQAAAATVLPDVRREVSALLAADGKPISRHGMGLGRHAGWLSKDLLRDGNWMRSNCERCPDTVNFLKSLPGLCECSLARAYFSILTAGKDIAPHHGRSNLKLRMQVRSVLSGVGHTRSDAADSMSHLTRGTSPAIACAASVDCGCRGLLRDDCRGRVAAICRRHSPPLRRFLSA